MAYPPFAQTQTSFTAFQQAQGDNRFPGPQLDTDLGLLVEAIDTLNQFVRGITRSDGEVGNQTIGPDQLKPGLALGLAPPTTWTAATLYAAGATVFTGLGYYRAVEGHTSGGAFGDDLAAGLWEVLIDFADSLAGGLPDVVAPIVSDLVPGIKADVLAGVPAIISTAAPGIVSTATAAVPGAVDALLDSHYVALAAVSDGVADASVALNAALAGGNVRLYIPAGTYYLAECVRLYENTVVEMHPDAIIKPDFAAKPAFLNGEYGNTTFSAGYTGPGNIHIIGGQFDMSLKAASDYTGPAIAFAHADNVSVERVRFFGHKQAHYVELNSTRRGRVLGCRFEAITLTSPGSRESINIDHASEVGFPHFGSYDDTPCDDILIRDNAFADGDVAVGSHTAPPVYHSRIIIENNTIDGMETCGLDARYWDLASSRVRNTRITDVPSGMEVKGTVHADGRFLVELADDAAIALPVPQFFVSVGAQGLVYVGAWSPQAGAPRGIYWINAGASPAIEVIAASATQSNIELTTGVLTTGTSDGTDGKFSVSPHSDGKLYLKNRSGVTRLLEVRFMAG